MRKHSMVNITRRFVIGPGYHIIDTHLDKTGSGGVVHLDGDRDSAIDTCRTMNNAYEAMHPLRILALVNTDGRLLGSRECPHGYRGHFTISVGSYGTLRYLCIVQGELKDGVVVREIKMETMALTTGDDVEVLIDGGL